MCSTIPAIRGLRRPKELRQRSDDQLTHREAGESARQRQPRHRRRDRQLVGDPRQRGQVHVDGQRAQRHQGTEHHNHPDAPGARTSA